MPQSSKLAPAWRQVQRMGFECGPYQLQAALEAHGKQVEIENLYFCRIFRWRDISLPWDHMILLERHGVPARLRFWRQGSFVNRTRDALGNGRSVIFLFHALNGRHKLHWGSVWGFDAENEQFWIYDPNRELRQGGVGNAVYSFSTIIAALPWKGTFVIEVGG